MVIAKTLGIGLIALIVCVGCGRKPADAPNDGGEAAKNGHDHGPGGHDETAMPKGVDGANFERELFLKPGGIYSEADIKANGNTVPSAKFAKLRWAHESDLKSGDRVCPVTKNKADERCYWIVNAKRYEFCCTPCLDNFVKLAKEQPGQVKDPDQYIQK